MDSTIYSAPNQFGETISYYQQTWPDSCAIMSQKFIMDEFGIVNPETGVPYTEDELVQYAADHGYYDGGTPLNEIGHIMNDAGIPCHLSVENNVYNLVEQLAQGHKVIVAVDADELWAGDDILTRLGEWFKELFMGEVPNHALVVTGIDTSDPNNVMVVVDDPGTGDHMKAYPLKEFMDAWQDSSCFMCSTDVPAPDLTNFDYTAGHIDNVCGVDYPEFCMFNDLSNSFNSFTPEAVYDDLYPAFEQMSEGTPMNDVLADTNFGEYIDMAALQQHFFDTNMQLLHGMANYQPAVMHQAMYGDIGEQMLAHEWSQQYDAIADAYAQNGDMAQAEFFHNQADFMDMCQVLGFDEAFSVMYPMMV